MEHCHSFKSIECSMVKPGVMVKIEEEELYDPQCDGCSETSTGYPAMKPEIVIKEERNEENAYTRSEEMYEDEESPGSSAGHYVKNVVVKLEADNGAYGMADPQCEERISSPEQSPDYIVVKIKEEEEEQPYGIDYHPPIDIGSRPQTSTGRGKNCKVHRMSSKMAIDIDQLIQMVHDRPELYDPKVPSYADRYKKKKAWEEICAVVVPDWDLCSDREKNLKAKEIQTRWRSLKDCFRRELTLQKKLERSGIPTNRRRKYVHYEGLLFLEPTMRLRHPFGGCPASTATSEDRETVEILQPIDLERSVSPNPLPPPLLPRPPPPPPPASPAPKRNRKKSQQTSESEWETHLLNVMNTLRKKSEENSDSDEIFLRSLLPFVKKVPEERKIDMQLSMMHVVKRFMEPPQPHDPKNNSTQIPPRPTWKLSRTRSHQRPTSPALDLSYKPPAPQTQPAAAQNSPEHKSNHGQQPYSSPSSSSSSINPSPQSHRDSPYYFDL
ncbi:uncharacterized protein [Engystomops pustulosus]|uniref:uncharacterized protein isoform X2 n=1 Tax=Engystomops pustulosus TaxID=76066 RepID=UPI003AFB12F4